jgi:hypothetical protein
MRKIDCAHRKILKKFFGGQKIEKNASKLGVISFNPNKTIFRSNFVRGIDCEHRKILKKFFGGQKPPKVILLGLKLNYVCPVITSFASKKYFIGLPTKLCKHSILFKSLLNYQ